MRSSRTGSSLGPMTCASAGSAYHAPYDGQRRSSRIVEAYSIAPTGPGPAGDEDDEEGDPGGDRGPGYPAAQATEAKRHRAKSIMPLGQRSHHT